jgi:hypothetical protein
VTLGLGLYESSGGGAFSYERGTPVAFGREEAFRIVGLGGRVWGERSRVKRLLSKV